MPLLRIDGLDLVQERSIVRYLAEKHGLRGATLADAALADMLAEGLRDWRDKFGRVFEFAYGGHDQAYEQKEVTRMSFDKYGPLFERRLAATNTGFLVHGAWTYADVLLFEVLDQLIREIPRLGGVE